MSESLTSTRTLNNGVAIPKLGLGVYMSPPGDVTRNAVKSALELGYRHVDTARVYGNEKDVGEAIRQSGLKREEIFVTTKLWNEDQGYDSTLRGCEDSLKDLGLDYVDLYLMHWPLPGKRLESWKAMVRLYEEKRCRAIGVSNFMEHHLDELQKDSGVVPAVNQMEFSPFLYQEALLFFCEERGIQLEAYSPLTRGVRLHDPRVESLADKYDVSSAQLFIRWALQHNVVVIPKSVHPKRIESNAEVFGFEISGRDMEEMDGWNENLHLCWDPTNEP